MKLKVNRKHFVDPENILKFKIKKGVICVYLKSGYPKILKCTEGFDVLISRMVNLNLNIKDFEFDNG